MKSKILLIGGAGTLGSDLIPVLSTNNDLFVIDNLLSSVLNRTTISDYADFFEVDAANSTDFSTTFRLIQPDVVIFLATSMSADQRIAYDSNVGALKNLISCAESENLPKIIYVQSFLTRNTAFPISESSTYEAKDSYSTWKLAAELLLASYSGQHTTVILSSVISPCLNVGAIPAFTSRILKNEHIKVTNSQRDYLNPEDFINFMSRLINSEVWNSCLVVGTGIPTSTSLILKEVCSALGRSLESVSFEEIEPAVSDPKVVSLDSSRVQRDFGLTFSSDFSKSIKATVDNFIQTNPVVRLHH